MFNTTTTTTTSTRSTRSRGLPGPVLVGGAFLLSTGVNILFHLGEIVFTDDDPYAPEGPVASIQGVALFGGAALLLALAIAIPSASDPRRARTAAVVLGVLTVVSLVVFWSGAPATLGAAAAWLAGFGRGAEPQTGVARGFGVVGLVLAVLTIVVHLVGPLAAALTGSA
jgi:hypothetical protein